ncbi:MAG TPA: type II secretion system protein GspC, partial [Kofleriaceae bacterium]|nr:type II secretion system protein GspC [Kofleriaceae bacterium]
LAPAESEPTAERPPDAELDPAAIDHAIRRVAPNKYAIDKSIVDQILANPMSVAKGARVVPSVKDGKPHGFKLYAIRPSSVFAKLGLENGDTLVTINGFDLTTADKALEIYTKLRDATTIEIELERKGVRITIDYVVE